MFIRLATVYLTDFTSIKHSKWVKLINKHFYPNKAGVSLYCQSTREATNFNMAQRIPGSVTRCGDFFNFWQNFKLLAILGPICGIRQKLNSQLWQFCVTVQSHYCKWPNIEKSCRLVTLN